VKGGVEERNWVEVTPQINVSRPSWGNYGGRGVNETIEVDTEAALSDKEAQRIHDQVQQQLDNI